MPQYVLVLDAHAMDDIPGVDMPDVDRAAHAVSQEAMDAGVWVCPDAASEQDVPQRADRPTAMRSAWKTRG